MPGDLFLQIIKNNVNSETLQWISHRASLIREEETTKELYTSFGMVPRKTGKKIISLEADQDLEIKHVRPGLSIRHWTIDRLTRVHLLLQAGHTNKEKYISKIEGLFTGAEMNELVALYSSLSLLAFPEEWRFRCTEGIRSNIGSVLEAIMYENPYPYENLDEPAWNQMVLKAFFTDKQVERITGLDERSNSQLAAVLFDYAHERWAAHRTVNIQLWRLTAKFINEDTFPDIKKLFYNGNGIEKKAAALACSQSAYQPAVDLLDETPELKSAIRENLLTWNNLVHT